MTEIVDGQFSDADEDGEIQWGKEEGKPFKLQIVDTFSNLSISEHNGPEDYDEDYESGSEDEELYYEDDDYEEGELEGYRKSNDNFRHSGTNSQAASKKVSNYQPSDKLFKKYVNKINVDRYEGPPLPNHVANKVMETEKKVEAERIRTKDKHDRATAEQVMDPRTRMILFKLLNRGVIREINGCISTGKEANVYHATTIKDGEPRDLAIKIYKTSILVFKDRDRYVSGEFRFRHGYSRHNPRKMVRTWAEKEMRNLLRMHAVGLPVPQPVLLRSHVLVMDFLGKEGWPSPKLKDVELSQSKACKLYRDTVTMMWTLYNKCKLVHADLSEYNMLYHEGQAYMIDVSQSVEHDHPHSLEFLRKDCTNITDFFHRNQVATMTVKELFDFVTDPTITEKNMESCLDRLSELAATRGSDMTDEQTVTEEVFKSAYIPQRLTEVIDFERDINLVKSDPEGKAAEDLTYRTLLGMGQDLNPQTTPELLVGESEESGGEESDEAEEGESKFVNAARPRDESPNSKKARKKAVKEQAAEKRKSKVPKHVKKRNEKVKKSTK
ncbi:serine/threonine-protein kinase RIO1-like [Macrosteles quadrilineatus]|uniref:serine/threonine-protein kinase RIO1-like n=1 Tax=Macrosteles quadrilineatus TaxID=74068 RepID=UPI0023E32CE6|nr:serine/threonine-protein kinase RIO1-like [Macrosteles quadrilineatus]